MLNLYAKQSKISITIEMISLLRRQLQCLAQVGSLISSRTNSMFRAYNEFEIKDTILKAKLWLPKDEVNKIDLGIHGSLVLTISASFGLQRSLHVQMYCNNITNDSGNASDNLSLSLIRTSPTEIHDPVRLQTLKFWLNRRQTFIGYCN